MESESVHLNRSINPCHLPIILSSVGHVTHDFWNHFMRFCKNYFPVILILIIQSGLHFAQQLSWHGTWLNYYCWCYSFVLIHPWVPDIATNKVGFLNATYCVYIWTFLSNQDNVSIVIHTSISYLYAANIIFILQNLTSMFYPIQFE